MVRVHCGAVARFSRCTDGFMDAAYQIRHIRQRDAALYVVWVLFRKIVVPLRAYYLLHAVLFRQNRRAEVLVRLPSPRATGYSLLSNVSASQLRSRIPFEHTIR